MTQPVLNNEYISIFPTCWNLNTRKQETNVIYRPPRTVIVTCHWFHIIKCVLHNKMCPFRRYQVYSTWQNQYQGHFHLSRETNHELIDLGMCLKIDRFERKSRNRNIWRWIIGFCDMWLIFHSIFKWLHNSNYSFI